MADYEDFCVVDAPASPSATAEGGAEDRARSLDSRALSSCGPPQGQSRGPSTWGGPSISPVRHMSIKWRRGAELPHGVYRAQTVQLGGKVYLGGGDAPDKYNVVQEYDTSTCAWRELPESPVERAALAELDGKLVLAGNHMEGQVMAGRHSQMENSTRITVWEADSSDWIHPYPHMESGRSYAAAVGYDENKLVVACGLARSLKTVGTVEVLKCTELAWKQAAAVPLEGHHMSSGVIDRNWFITAHYWNDGKPHVFSCHLHQLTSSAASVWWELEAPPVKAATLQVYRNQLLLLGGLKSAVLTRKDVFQDDIYTYNPLRDSWHKFGKLPKKMSGCSSTVLPSGELMVMGGFLSGEQEYSKNVWIGTLN